jgi:uncharacterized protein (TIGR03790 family)
LNVAVVVNQNSSNALELANYFCEKRQVPPQNVLRVNWTGGNISWAPSDLQTVILNPLLAMLSSRQLTNQIDYIAVCMDLPFLVMDSTGTNSTTSSLFYGFKTDLPAFPSYNPASCNLPAASSNSYAAGESIFRLTPPTSPRSNSWLVTMLTGSNLPMAKMLVDQGVNSDRTFPTQTVYLAKSDDIFRNVRYVSFDNAIFEARLRGNYSMQRTNINWIAGLGTILGAETGYQNYGIYTVGFVPGAMADNLTSYGGVISGTDHLNILALVNVGAAGVYGTVVEPCAYLEKFPSPLNYFYQARGFSLAECYYQSVTNPYQGLLVGEPLAAPFAQPGSGSWNNLTTNALLSGTTNLSLVFNASDAQHPIQQVDLFLDGTFVQTLTNIPPNQNNTLNVTLNGSLTSYVVPASATIKSVVSNLTVKLNQTATTNLTKVIASAHGDRIQLQSFDSSKSGSQVSISVSALGGVSPQTTFINASGSTFFDSVASGLRGYTITNVPQLGDYLQFIAIKTNGQTVIVSVTNTMSGTTLSQLAKALFAAVNTNAALVSADGLAVEDIIMHEDYAPYGIYPTDDHSGEFNVRARAGGWAQSQIQAAVTGSPTFTGVPSGTNHLDDNVLDLEPRAHVYITAGATNIPVAFGFNTTTQANGYHDLTAVVYEGSHVRTQQRVSQTVRIQNGALSATFNTLVGDTNTAIEATLQFSVVANTNNVTNIVFYSTGGPLATNVNQSSATFSVLGTTLGVGLHPFYGIVSTSDGKKYRTETKWIRLITTESPFPVSVHASALTLSWPATAGRSYDILSATNPMNAFQMLQTVVPTNSAALWVDTNAPGRQRFYRVRTSN